MASLGFTYWPDGEMWLGYFDQYPDYMTQGTSLEDLKEHLLDLYKDLFLERSQMFVRPR
jgi:predicted RNase H-like HicB family nuclease